MIKFRALRSGSKGNALLLYTAEGGVLVDFAPGSQRECRALLAEVKKKTAIRGVLVTHAHGDHINRNSLKVLAEAGLNVYCHPKVLAQIKERHGYEYAGIIRTYEASVTVGGFTAEQAEVEHSPRCYTNALTIKASAGGRRYKASVFTDLTRFTPEHINMAAGSDLIYLEANHDPELLARYGHPGSEYHLSNPQAAEFLHRVCAGGPAPAAVVLGHLSEDCNSPELPAAEIRNYFKAKAAPLAFGLHVTPRLGPGEEISIER